MSKLLPCPFCGGEPTGPFKPPFEGSDERCGYNFRVIVSCRCGASISRESRKDHAGWCIDNGEAKKAVTEAWNRRAPKGDAS
jgi:hypothetical protein